MTIGASPREPRSASTAASTRSASTADPTAAILSVALLLRHLGHTAEADRVEEAVEADLGSRGDAPIVTSEVGDRIVAAVSG